MNNPFSLENKTILITGASSGIGKATAILCAQMGAKLIVTGKTESKLDEVFDSLVGECHQKIIVDFENENAIIDLIAMVNKLDGIVHSAGILETIPLAFTNSEKLSRIMRINFEVPFSITQQLLKSKKFNKDTSIVFVSSLSGYSTVATGISAYSASKGAISASIRVMALELASKKIRVNAVCPGMVKTEMNSENDNLTKAQLLEDEKRNYPLGYGTSKQIASSIAFLLGEGSSWITGTNLVIDGGASIH
jgi:NAD(P)-dependent dehydrogenase (short-subunit alcohol dehydrogenase family)